MADIIFDRSQVEINNNKKVRSIYDFAYGEYVALNRFFSELTRVQDSILNNNGKVDLPTGQSLDINTVGGSLGLNIYFESLDTGKTTTTGLAKLGLKNENKLWTLLG